MYFVSTFRVCHQPNVGFRAICFDCVLLSLSLSLLEVIFVCHVINALPYYVIFYFSSVCMCVCVVLILSRSSS